VSTRSVALDGLEWEAVNDRLVRKVIDGERMTATRYRFAPGGRFPLHSHDQEQLAYVLRGQLTFSLPEADHVLAPDGMIVIEPNVPHSAEAGPEGAEVLSVVTPARTGGRGVEVLEDNDGGS
jgi:quercetin dioxygenase-like cupin family protein